MHLIIVCTHSNAKSEFDPGRWPCQYDIRCSLSALLFIVFLEFHYFSRWVFPAILFSGSSSTLYGAMKCQLYTTVQHQHEWRFMALESFLLVEGVNIVPGGLGTQKVSPTTKNGGTPTN